MGLLKPTGIRPCPRSTNLQFESLQSLKGVRMVPDLHLRDSNSGRTVASRPATWLLDVLSTALRRARPAQPANCPSQGIPANCHGCQSPGHSLRECPRLPVGRWCHCLHASTTCAWCTRVRERIILSPGWVSRAVMPVRSSSMSTRHRCPNETGCCPASRLPRRGHCTDATASRRCGVQSTRLISCRRCGPRSSTALLWQKRQTAAPRSAEPLTPRAAWPSPAVRRRRTRKRPWWRPRYTCVRASTSSRQELLAGSRLPLDPGDRR